MTFMCHNVTNNGLYKQYMHKTDTSPHIMRTKMKHNTFFPCFLLEK